MNQLENIQCNNDADEETIEYERIQEAEIVDILSEEDQLWKVKPKLGRNLFSLSMVKKGNFNKAP